MPKARQSAKTNPGMYSKDTKAKNAAEKKVHQDAVRAALAFTQFHGKSTVWAMKHGDFAASVTKNILDKALAGKLVYCNSDRREDSILTELESERLITWIKGCAQNTNPAFDAEISQQVIKMLRVRWTFNKTKKHSKVGGCIPLTAAEMRLVRQEKAVAQPTSATSTEEQWPSARSGRQRRPWRQRSVRSWQRARQRWRRKRQDASSHGGGTRRMRARPLQATRARALSSRVLWRR